MNCLQIIRKIIQATKEYDVKKYGRISHLYLLMLSVFIMLLYSSAVEN